MCVCIFLWGTRTCKGVFDGVGGAIKNKVHSLIKATKTSDDSVPGVDSGYINNVTDVVQAIHHYLRTVNTVSGGELVAIQSIITNSFCISLTRIQLDVQKKRLISYTEF
jgi:hypothetical protein